MALRLLLGFLEAVTFPSLTLIVQSFYTTAEQPSRNASELHHAQVTVLVSGSDLTSSRFCLLLIHFQRLLRLPHRPDSSNCPSRSMAILVPADRKHKCALVRFPLLYTSR